MLKALGWVIVFAILLLLIYVAGSQIAPNLNPMNHCTPTCQDSSSVQ